MRLLTIINQTFQDKKNYQSNSLNRRQIIRFIRLFTRTSPGNIIPLFRLCQLLNDPKTVGGRFMRRLALRKFNRMIDLFCITLPLETKIGTGVSFPHNGPIVFNPSAVIGKNCIIHPCVLIGRNRSKEGFPTIGDNCFIGNGAKIIGNPTIGDWCFIAPGAIVSKDIPSGAIVGGINNILSMDGKDHVRAYQHL